MNIRGGSTTVPSAGYADLPPGIGFEPKDEPLRRDINLLGRVLGRILIEQEGEILFETEEEVRLLCKRLRFDYDPELDERLRRRIEAMSVEELRRIVRAFSVYFLLVNIAERYHRVRRRQYESAPDNPPQRASVASALARLKGEGLGQEALRRVLDGMAVGPARYDRPSDGGHEAERQAQAREDRGDARGYGVARSNVEGAKASGGGFGRGDHHSVADRRAQGLSSRGKPGDREDTTVLREPFDLRNARSVQGIRERELARQFPEDTPRLGRVLESGSWVGGDQDGNPFVEPEMITTALGLHRDIIIERHLASAVWLADHIGQSAGMIPVSEDLRRSVERDEVLMPGLVGRYRGIDPNEVYRHKLLFMSEGLRLALGQPGAPSAYPGVSEFLDDLFKIRDSLLQNGGVRAAEGRLRDLIRQAEVFGFHLAKLDVRQVSSTVVRAVAHLVSASTGEDLLSMDEAAHAALLRRLLADLGLSLPDPEEVSEETRKVLETFWCIGHAKEEHSGTPVEIFILSMARNASDVLSVQLLARRAGLLEVEEGGRCTANYLRVTPLFETVDDLGRAPEVLGHLLEDPFYRSSWIPACAGMTVTLRAIG